MTFLFGLSELSGNLQEVFLLSDGNEMKTGTDMKTGRGKETVFAQFVPLNFFLNSEKLREPGQAQIGPRL
jgi:hypothetical protein